MIINKLNLALMCFIVQPSALNKINRDGGVVNLLIHIVPSSPRLFTAALVHSLDYTQYCCLLCLCSSVPPSMQYLPHYFLFCFLNVYLPFLFQFRCHIWDPLCFLTSSTRLQACQDLLHHNNSLYSLIVFLLLMYLSLYIFIVQHSTYHIVGVQYIFDECINKCH